MLPTLCSLRTHSAFTQSSKADEGSRKNKPVMRTFSQTKGKEDQSKGKDESKPKPKSDKAADEAETDETAVEAAAFEVLILLLRSLHFWKSLDDGFGPSREDTGFAPSKKATFCRMIP